jgi:DNA-binding SARP family transcriptional activator
MVMSGAPKSLPGRSEAPEAARFRLLGPVEVWSGDGPIDLGGPLQRALLATLLLHRGEVVSRERLIDALWDVDPPAHAAHTLETKVSRLRAVLGAEASVVARGGGYVLEAPADHVDVCRFQQGVARARGPLSADPYAAKTCLVTALDLWRGSALGGVSPELLSVERDRLDEERLQAIEARIDADLALGGGPLLVSELEVLRAEHRCASASSSS